MKDNIIKPTQDPSLKKLPPQNIEAEESILSAILIDNTTLLDILEILSPDDFYRTVHKKIFTAMSELFSKNEPVTLIDTNTVRVTGRVLGLDLSGEARRRKEVKEAIAEIVDPKNPRDFYYSMIDLAHNICTPSKPDCRNCPLLDVPCKTGQEIIKAS